MREKVKCLPRFLSKLFFAFGLFVSPLKVYGAQDALVITDGAIVYKKPDFDAAIVGYFRAGQKVRVSDKAFGPFFRVRFKQGVIGYIADIDVRASGKKSVEKNSEKSSARPSAKSESSKPSGNPTGSHLTRSFAGLTFGLVNWTEVFEASSLNKEYSDSLLFYGVRGDFPFGSIMSGPFTLSTSLAFAFSAPKYLKEASSIVPSGLIGIAEASLLYTFSEMDRRRLAFYFGAGPTATYNSFRVELFGSKQDLLEVQLGGVGSLGAGYRMRGFILRLDGKYYLTKVAFWGIYGSAQIDF